jgi:hypothetical protein
VQARAAQRPPSDDPVGAWGAEGDADFDLLEDAKTSPDAADWRSIALLQARIIRFCIDRWHREVRS